MPHVFLWLAAIIGAASIIYTMEIKTDEFAIFREQRLKYHAPETSRQPPPLHSLTALPVGSMTLAATFTTTAAPTQTPMLSATPTHTTVTTSSSSSTPLSRYEQQALAAERAREIVTTRVRMEVTDATIYSLVDGSVSAVVVGEEKIRASRRSHSPSRFSFFSGGGYCSEAISFATSLAGTVRMKIGHFADSYNYEFYKGLDDVTSTLLNYLAYQRADPKSSVVVCHSEPGAWDPPMYSTALCPPYGERPAYLIGRTMFETDRIPLSWVARCNKMDEVWVPTEFHVDTFRSCGVTVDLVKIPEPVDVDFFDPNITEPLQVPFGTKVVYVGAQDDHYRQNSSNITMPMPSQNLNSSSGDPPFRFLSVFKWEPRKAWDVLVRAYINEFSIDDHVELYLLTNAFHTDGNFAEKIDAFVKDMNMSTTKQRRLPLIYVIDTHVAQRDLPRLYRAMDAFVLPSRGEGWGRPHVEAMSMGLPVIATNFSGPTEYLNDENGYLLRLSGMQTIEKGAFRTHKWADPSSEHLQELMRHVVTHPQEAKQKGLRARQTMATKYRPEQVAAIVKDRLKVIKQRMDERRAANEEEALANSQKQTLLKVDP